MGGSQQTNLPKYFKPDMFCPMRSNWSDEECLKLDISKNHVAVHTHPGSTGCFAIEVSRTDEVIKRRLQSKFEIGAVNWARDQL